MRGLTLTEVAYVPGLRLARHFHENACLCLVLGGAFNETIGRQSFDCAGNAVIYRPAGCEHSDEFHNCWTRCLLVEFKASYTDHFGEGIPQLQLPSSLCEPTSVGRLLHISREWHCADLATPLAIEGLVLEFLAELARKDEHHTRQSTPPQWLSNAREVLDHVHPGTFNLHCLAARVNVHPAHLARTFRRYYRCSIGEYVRQRRIVFACEALRAPSRSIADIALAAGYSDQAHFARAFKRVVKLAPGEFRRRYHVRAKMQ